jgi:hypothetical protein
VQYGTRQYKKNSIHMSEEGTGVYFSGFAACCYLLRDFRQLQVGLLLLHGRGVSGDRRKRADSRWQIGGVVSV